jgi:predicted short-subunit dehydrogenase-like oxidoreductase (DUF2520 family)
MPANDNKKLRLGFIGTGTVGSALAIRLSDRGYPVAAVSSRGFATAAKLASSIKGCRACENNQQVADNADFVFITTPDAAIPVVASQVNWHGGQYIVHCSGADSLDVLETAVKYGATPGGFHPLQTFASVQKAIENLPGSTFGLEAQEPLLEILKIMADDLKGNWVVLEAKDKVAYHAAAVITSNYTVTLMQMATELWQTFNVPRDQATRALLPLLKGTLNNIENVGLPDCLTGPIARGDGGTVKKHLAALSKLKPELESTYRELGLQTIPVALAKGRINKSVAEDLREILETKS